MASLLSAAGCNSEPHPLRWGFSFDSDADRMRAVFVDAVIAEGSCDGTVQYESLIQVSTGVSAERPNTLDPGHYCFRGRARDIDCNWFVSGELELDLPTEQSPIIVALNTPETGAACAMMECSEGLCTGETLDGGMDATPDSMLDGTTDSTVVDSGTDTRADTRPPDTGITDTCVSMMETCNGLDDDCDGRTDEDFDLNTDDANCGSCGMACTGDLSCMSGSCDCPSSLTFDPPNNCIDTTADPSNCGAVGTVCRDDQWCRDSICECRPGLTDASGTCVDLSTDPMNCGSIGNDCSTMGSMVTCRNTCEDSCNAGQTNCSNACVDLNSDDFNCGLCGNACSRDRFCRAGRCDRYVVATGCSSCPCGACGGGTFDNCTSYGSATICYND